MSIEWTPDKDTKWNLHAHAGLFSNRFSIYDYAEILREDGVHRATSTVYNPVFGDPWSGGATPIYSERRLARPFTNSSYETYSIGGTFAPSKAFTRSADLCKGRLWNLYRSNNINAPLNDSPTGPRPFAPNLDVLQAQNSGQGRLDFAFFAVENHSLERAQFYVGSVHLDQIDDTDDSTFFTPQNSRSNAGEFARRSGQPAWQILANGTFQSPEKVQFSFNLSSAGDAPYNITTGFDNNGDGDFNNRPQFADPGAPNSVPTQYGLLTTAGGMGVFSRNKGVMPWTTHVDANLQRTFKLT